MSAEGSSAPVEAIYAERNAVAFAFVAHARLAGWSAGVKSSDDPEWPILMAETPCGQVSWHVPAHMVPEGFPAWNGREWDGHDEAEKSHRLKVFCEWAARFSA